jgi:hypothetical protein
MRTSAISATSISLWPVPTVSRHHVLAGCVEGIDDAHGSRAQAAEIAAARQRAHEHAIVIEGGRHAHAIAENGAA